jgi:hypothetical protein
MQVEGPQKKTEKLKADLTGARLPPSIEAIHTRVWESTFFLNFPHEF